MRRTGVFLLAALAACSRSDDAVEVSASEHALTGATRTFEVDIHVFCEGGDCEQTDDAFERGMLESFEGVNLKWRFAKISFRPIRRIHLHSKFVHINADTGPSDIPGVTNEELREELDSTVADANPQSIALYILPNWDCGGGTRSMHCGSLPVSSITHELGHYFCLSHTFNRRDLPDLAADYDRDNIADTPPDPSNQRPFRGTEIDDLDEDGVPYPHRVWCDKTEHQGAEPGPGIQVTDSGSPLNSFCTAECFQSLADRTVTSAPFAPLTENAMSYYGGDCKGPYVLDGVRHEAFTVGQRDKIQQCATNRHATLVDICEDKGGDSDSDGLCDTEDPCPQRPALAGLDRDLDGDGLLDGCDSCPAHSGAGSTSDFDNDGVCDAADHDMDNDGCSNSLDGNPMSAWYLSGSRVGDNCSEGVYTFEGNDSDGDGRLDCHELETDNDSDGVPDAKDKCPADPANRCHLRVSCPLYPAWYLGCKLGGCNEHVVKLVSAVNPQHVVTFPSIEIANRTLYLRSLPDQTASETARTLLGSTMPFGMADRLRLELWHIKGSSMKALIAEFSPKEIPLGAIDRGSTVAFTPASGRLPARLETTWGPTVTSATDLADLDRDGVPDFADNCPSQMNLWQGDQDRDRIGDTCDPDFTPEVELECSVED
jgi:hypothetical protein